MNEFKVYVKDFVTKNKNPIKSVYRIGKRIGEEGAYSYIRYCIHRETGCLRAVKVIDKKKLSNIEQTELDIINEISILRQVDHPGIMRIYEYFEDLSHFYIISDFFQGGELYEYIRETIDSNA